VSHRGRRIAGLGLLLLAVSCDQSPSKASRGRSEAISSASREMSGPSLFSGDSLPAAIALLRSKASGRVLRLEIRAREVVLQAEDSATPGAVVEYHYRDGKVGEPEHATLRGKGQLADNLFDLSDVRLGAVPALTREAVRRIDAEAGSVELVLLRRNLPDSEDVRFRVYVSSPRQSGSLAADRTGQPL
jgi:hypothetical protein